VQPNPPFRGPVPGSTLGNYRIERLLGSGGMGAVFLAHDTTLGRKVALKIVDPAGDPQISRARVLREGRSAAALNHPNICTIHPVRPIRRSRAPNVRSRRTIPTFLTWRAPAIGHPSAPIPASAR